MMPSKKGFYKIGIVDFTKSTRTNMSLILKNGRIAQKGRMSLVGASCLGTTNCFGTAKQLARISSVVINFKLILLKAPFISGLNSSIMGNSLSWASSDKKPLHHKCKCGPQKPLGWNDFCISVSAAWQKHSL